MVDQFVVVGGDITAKGTALGFQRRQRGSDTPGVKGIALRTLDIDDVRGIFLADHAQEYAGAVEETVGLVQMRGTHRQIPRIHQVMQCQRPVARRRLP